MVEKAMFAAAQAGDPLALDLLLRQLQPDIRRYARFQCHRSSAIEDVVQEALIIVYRKVGSVRDAAAVAGWMFRIVARLCMLPVLGFMRGAEQIEAVQDDARFATMPQDDLRIDLIRALESLPAIYREVLLLRDMEQLTITEIAQLLRITREATKSRIHRARSLVREYLLGGQPGPGNAEAAP
jgi:RNA polymerase sigma factor (sigma-70 family)